MLYVLSFAIELRLPEAGLLVNQLAQEIQMPTALWVRKIACVLPYAHAVVTFPICPRTGI